MYTALPIRQSVTRTNPTVVATKIKGENLRDLPQLLKPEFAQRIDNYIITGEGGLEKRKGRDLKFVTGNLAAYENIVGQWLLDEGSETVALDTSGYGNNGTINNGTWVEGNVNGVEFDGVAGATNITIPDATEIQDIFDGGGTVMIVAEPYSLGGSSNPMLFNKTGSTTNGWGLNITNLSGSSAQLLLTQNFTTGTSRSFSSGRPIKLNERNVIIVKYDNSTTTNEATLYVNGVKLTTAFSGGATGTRKTDVGQDLYVGNRSDGNRTWDGVIGSFKFINKMVSDDEALALYNNTVVDSVVCSMQEEWTDDLVVLGFDTTVAVRDLSTDTTTYVKTDFSANSGFRGRRYGDYFFVCNGVDKIWRISKTLNYVGQTSNFTVGDIITGATSGATAVVLEDSDAGATGTLTLGSINGVFETAEAITSASGGDGTVYRSLIYAIEEITASPVCSVLYVFGNRLVAGRLIADPSAIQYSDIDDGTNPPFDNWNISINADEGGKVSFRNAGDVNDIVSLGQYIVVFADKGKWAFAIDTIDSAGTLVKIDQTILSRIDFGGNRAIETNKGVFYVNSAGLWQLVSVGQQDVPFSEQEVVTSELLGKNYFVDIDFSDSDMVYDPALRIVYTTCRDNSSSNNFIFGYAIDFKAFFRITSWAIKRFLRVNKDYYGTSSANGDFFQLFEGTSDDGDTIETEYRQEITVNRLWARSDLLGIYAQTRQSTDEVIELHFDIYDREGTKQTDARVLTIQTSGLTEDAEGWGETSWGESSWGGSGADDEDDDLVSVFSGSRAFVRNFQRIILRITTSSTLRHRIDWVSLLTKDKGDIRNRQMTQTT